MFAPKRYCCLGSLFGSAIIDTDIVNDSCSTANTAVPAKFAGLPAAKRFVGNVGCNKKKNACRFFSIGQPFRVAPMVCDNPLIYDIGSRGQIYLASSNKFQPILLFLSGKTGIFKADGKGGSCSVEKMEWALADAFQQGNVKSVDAYRALCVAVAQAEILTLFTEIPQNDGSGGWIPGTDDGHVAFDVGHFAKLRQDGSFPG